MVRLRPSGRQVRRALALTLFGFVGLVVFGASAAPAAPAIPGFPDCKDAPVAAWPGTGIPGALDPAPASPPGRGDPFATPPTSSVYEQYGYAGLTWHTYDLGCGGAMRDVEATLDTSVGNFFLNLGVWGTAATNGLHNRVAHPQDYMGPLDSVVDVVTARLHDAVWTPWGGAALLGVAAILLVYALRGSLSSVTSAAVWAVLVLTVLAAVSQYPSRAARFFDDAVTSSISSINTGAAGLSAGTGTRDPARTQGAMLVDSVLYDAWLRGTFGDSHSVAAKRWGPTLFKASTLSWREAAQSADPEQALAIADAKTQQWRDTAALIAEQDPATYAVLQGKAGGRFGTGLLAMLGAMFTGLFRLVADAFLFAGLVMLRLVIMFFPAVAVIGVMSPLASIVRRVANLSAASVVNVVAFAAGSAIHTAAVSAILSYARGAGMQILALILSLAITVCASVLLAPLLSFRKVLGDSRHRRHRLLGAISRYGFGYGIAHHAVEHGTDEALPRRLAR